jgi:2-oxoisovalerate dehydrogenase E1 component alpha subunit
MDVVSVSGQTPARPGESPSDLGLGEDDLRRILYSMMLSRAIGERQRLLQRMGKGPFAVTGEGHEAAQAGTAFALRPGVDWAFPYYRDMAVAVTLGQTARDLMLEFMSRAEAVSSGGRNMPSHFSDRKLRIVSGSAVVATQVPHAAGVAFAAKLRGLDEVAMTWFGDGGSSKGECHEAMNFAGLHKLPVVFVCENNQYAISVPASKQIAGGSVAARAEGYGFPGVRVDGNDVLAVYHAAREAVERARGGQGPSLIEAMTYRLVPHTSDDDDRRYRSREEVEEWGARDPIPRFQAYLEERGLLDAKRRDALVKKAAEEVDAATEYAEKAPLPEPESALGHVFAEEER